MAETLAAVTVNTNCRSAMDRLKKGGPLFGRMREWADPADSHFSRFSVREEREFQCQYSASNGKARMSAAFGIRMRTVDSTPSPQSKPHAVVSIPVRDVSPGPQTEQMAAAVKIQSAFRGYLVRKGAPLTNLKLIARVRDETSRIRQRLQKPQEANAVRQNLKERLRISEQLMSLLLKLDTIQGVHPFVRESRRAAVAGIINLQKTLDAMNSSL